MFFEQASNKQKLEGFVPQQPGFYNIEKEMKERQMAFQNMNQEWDVLGMDSFFGLSLN